MALYYTLPVYRDTYKMILLIFQITKEFPKEYKYTLGQDLKRDSMQLVRHIYIANLEGGQARVKALERFSYDFELIKLQLRLAFDLHIVAQQPLANITELMDIIGKQVTGWRKRVPTVEHSHDVSD